ncbi:MAG: hypothetical protein EOO74_03675 [Myxococcales bacterium]|nr:MAG: hypothetical protein EOO74_03675 [Myxococcales bacterium]
MWIKNVNAMLAQCRSNKSVVAHLYFEGNERYFEEERDRYESGDMWTFTATPGHGVGRPKRKTINFLIANNEFANNYVEAAISKGFIHGVLVKRSALEVYNEFKGFDFCEVIPGHPNIYSDVLENYWRYDIPQHRRGVLGALSHAIVARVAVGARTDGIGVAQEDVITWW